MQLVQDAPRAKTSTLESIHGYSIGVHTDPRHHRLLRSALYQTLVANPEHLQVRFCWLASVFGLSKCADELVVELNCCYDVVSSYLRLSSCTRL